MIPIALAILALFQTKWQTQISNKQRLLTLRLEKIIFVSELLSLCGRNHTFFKDNESGPDFSNSLLFEYLTDCSALSDCTDAITHTLENSHQRKLLTCVEKLKCAAMECELIFSGEEAKSLETFLQAYADALNELYKYQIVLDKMEQARKDYPDRELEKIQELTKEPKRLQERNLALEKLVNEYDAIKGTRTEEKIKEQVRILKL